jgi:hypothetical protein
MVPGQILIDLARGRGGYGPEAARRTGARRAGPDFSAVAVAIAAHAAPPGRARSCAGGVTAPGLRDHSADAVMRTDAIQFSDPPLAALSAAGSWPAGAGWRSPRGSRAGRFPRGCRSGSAG